MSMPKSALTRVVSGAVAAVVLLAVPAVCRLLWRYGCLRATSTARVGRSGAGGRFAGGEQLAVHQ